MAPPRTKPDMCVLFGCERAANVKGTAQGFCILHYNRVRRYGWCEAVYLDCDQPAVNHLGLCERHTPKGVAA